MKSVLNSLLKFLSYLMTMIKFISSFCKLRDSKENNELHHDSEHDEEGEHNESSSK